MSGNDVNTCVFKVVVFIGFLSSACANNDTSDEQNKPETYCEPMYSCGKEPNTVCKFKCKTQWGCKKFEEVALSDIERQYIIDLHNYYRNFVALGKDTRGGNDEASNMNVLNYDKNLEWVAGCWAKQCHLTQEAECRKTKDFLSAGNGQNIWSFQHPITFNYLDPMLLLHGAHTWYREIKHMTKDRLKRFHLSSMSNEVRHFSQLVWANTSRVGCARVAWISNTSKVANYTFQLNCNYGPRGNVPLHPVYLYGYPASNCPNKTKRNNEYRGLCGEIKHLSSNRFSIEMPNGSAFITFNVFLSAVFCLLIAIVIYVHG